MKHNVKTVSRFLLLSLTLGCGFFALGQNNRSLSAAHAEGEASSTQQRTYTAADFADEVPVDPEQLDVSLIQSTTMVYFLSFMYFRFELNVIDFPSEAPDFFSSMVTSTS